MFYIHQTACISPQHTFEEPDLDTLTESEMNELQVIEPVSESIPPALRRRMGKAVRIGVEAGLKILRNSKADGIVIGTSNGGLEDCVKFLVQIVDFEEGRLTPTNFVQSTPNSIAGQLGLLSANKGYNITHTHRGLAFENALLDVYMLLNENPDAAYLLGGIDEISAYNHAIEKLGGWYKQTPVPNRDLYKIRSGGSLAGEGSAMFLVSKISEGARAKVIGIRTIHTSNPEEVFRSYLDFTDLVKETQPDLLVSGENGDMRFLPFYQGIEKLLPDDTGIVRYKHLTGEYPTSSAFALWLAVFLFASKPLPSHLVKRSPTKPNRLTLIYNNFKGEQHSFILVENTQV